MQWKPLELSEQDKAFLEAMEQNTKDLIAIFGIAPSLVGVQTFTENDSTSTNSNKWEAAYGLKKTRILEV